MPKKLSVVEQDILSILQRVEPSMLLWREIKAMLWPLHGRKYKDEKVFGVALSNVLTRNEGKLWKHEGDYWGTLKSSPAGTEKQKIQEKPSVEASEFLKALIPQFFKEREETQQLLRKGMAFTAWDKTQRFSEILPLSKEKQQLMTEVKNVNEKLKEIKDAHVYVSHMPFSSKPGCMPKYLFSSEDKQKALLYEAIPEVWKQIANILSTAT